MPQNNRTLKGVLGGLVGLVGLSLVAGVLVSATVTPAIAMTGLAGSAAIDLFEDLPNDFQPDAPMEPTTIWASNADGTPSKLASFYDQNRIPVTYEQVAPILYDSILSSEDKSFYEHGGINIGATAKALIDYAKGTSSRGASTISQQYVKNVLVQRCEKNTSPSEENYAEKLQDCWNQATNASGADGMKRKLQEMRYAIQVEKDFSKNDILLGYLNLANFGGTTYGIEAASRYYFNTSAAALTINQAATLAGMVQNPNSYRIDRPEGSMTDTEGNAINSRADGYAETLVRRNYVLQRLLDDGKITQEQYDATYAEPITPVITPATQGCAEAGKSAYFCQYVKSIIQNDEAFGKDAAERRDTLQRGGLDIYTTLNLDMQRTAIETMVDNVPAAKEGINVGAVGVQVEAGTGRILALTQNTDFNETSNAAPGSGLSAQVYAADVNHGSSTGFNVGSTYKLFTLLDWLEKGHSVNEVLDGKLKTFTPFTICGDTVPNSAKINNSGKVSGYTGTVMKFTSASLNTGYLAMAQQLDLCDINKMAERLGVTLGNGKPVTTDNFPGDVIGSKAIAPLSMASAYATVANKGIYCPPRAIDRIVKQDGTEMGLPASTCEQVISPEVAATAAYALRGVMYGGTGGAANPGDGVPVIGKTGTHEATQTMMIESSSKVTTAVWVGNASGNASLRAHGLSSKRFYIAEDMQRAANRIFGGDSFPEPDRNLTRQVLKDLPDVVGKTIADATATLENAGFTVAVGPPVDSNLGTDLVAAQSPGAGKVAGGVTVTISPSNGQGTTVPNVVGQKASKAQADLASAGLSNITWDASCAQPNADVESTTPAAGTATNRSAVISVVCKAAEGNGNGNDG
ncbi:transglycosylase domain-containing protein [Microbacterium sp. M28]|uniref:transglycosylase domain-containing protein n=1 Tax=Microbacterium sp. M28 TaxID=2962064 RepID=UPI0021F3CF6F|nr:transglycosylase domain-containing protein [Microbacterium sp. M28]UYO97876.1 transglycosylase domain-containing protein [Microbacterium sp. M28]